MANINTLKLFKDINRKRKTMKEYSRLTKKEILIALKQYFCTYDKLRNLYCNKCLETDYLNRRVTQLTNRLKYFNSGGSHHSFRDVDKKIKEGGK